MKTSFELGFEKRAGLLSHMAIGGAIGAGVGAAGGAYASHEGDRMYGALMGGTAGGLLGAGTGALVHTFRKQPSVAASATPPPAGTPFAGKVPDPAQAHANAMAGVGGGRRTVHVNPAGSPSPGVIDEAIAKDPLAAANLYRGHLNDEQIMKIIQKEPLRRGARLKKYFNKAHVDYYVDNHPNVAKAHLRDMLSPDHIERLRAAGKLSDAEWHILQGHGGIPGGIEKKAFFVGFSSRQRW